MNRLQLVFMPCICALMFLAAPRGVAAAVATPTPTPVPLEGKKVAVRIYGSAVGSGSAAAYEIRELPIQNGRLNIPPLGDANALILHSDQSDPDVSAQLKGKLWLLESGRPWHFNFGEHSGGRLLQDALGQPLPSDNLSVDLIFKQRRIALTQSDLKTTGPAMLPHLQMEPARPFPANLEGIAITLPTLGTALFSWHEADPDKPLPLPLVSKDSPAAARALRGVIQTTTGLPIARAVLHCSTVRTPGEGLVQCSDAAIETDASGAFLFYPPMPVSSRAELQLGNLLSPGSRFMCNVTFPADSGFTFPYTGDPTNAQEVVITPPRTDGFHRFEFLDAKGAAYPAGVLQNFQFQFVPANRELSVKLPASYVTTGGAIPNGQYAVSTDGVAAYAPITITPSTPELVQVRPIAATIVRGSVRHAVTGQPVAGAFVLAEGGTGDRLYLSPAQWARLRAMPDPTNTDDPAWEPVRQAQQFSIAVPVAADGSWEIKTPSGTPLFNIMVLAEHYMTFTRPLRDLKPSPQSGAIEVTPIKLYPAAMVTVQAALPGDFTKQISIAPRWAIDPEGNPPWAREVADWVNWKNQNNGQFAYDDWIKIGQPVSIEAPAGLHMRLTLTSPYTEELGVARTAESFVVDQGTSRGLGVLTVPYNAQVAVKVSDETGKPIEGLPLRTKTGRRWSIPHNSNAQGLAFFFTTPSQPITVGYDYSDRNDHNQTSRTIEITATGNEKIPPLFNLTVDRALAEKILAEK